MQKRQKWHFRVVYDKPERGYKDFGCEQSRHILSRRSRTESTSQLVEFPLPNICIIAWSEEDRDGIHDRNCDDIIAAHCIHNRLCDRGGLPAITVRRSDTRTEHHGENRSRIQEQV